MPRASFHDYTSRCIYHITMCKASGMPPFGKLRSNSGEAIIEKSILGSIIECNILRLQEYNPKLRILQYVVMPDHIHFLLFATDKIERPIGRYIGMMKVHTGQDFRTAGGSEGPVFENDFNDRILHRSRSLDTIIRYIRDNPRRLAVRRAHPEYFRRVNSLEIDGERYAAYGNLQLLQNPFKEQVVVHRSDSSECRKQNHDAWLHTASNGGVLVSPFISPAEKAIRAEAEEAGAKIILIVNTKMEERYKPAAHDFELCEAGRLLIISMPAEISRSHCLAMNALAAKIASK